MFPGNVVDPRALCRKQVAGERDPLCFPCPARYPSERLYSEYETQSRLQIQKAAKWTGVKALGSDSILTRMSLHGSADELCSGVLPESIPTFDNVPFSDAARSDGEVRASGVQGLGRGCPARGRDVGHVTGRGRRDRTGNQEVAHVRQLRK